MMISAKMAKALNDQVAAEYGSYYIYAAMSYKLETMNLPIFAKWFDLQANEEKEHAEKIAKYLLEQGAEVNLQALPAPKATWKTCLAICEEALKHEKYITQRIHDLKALAAKEKDYATDSFLNWFVDEQVEEVASTSELVEMVKLTKTPGQLLQLEGRVWRLVEARK
jgi:ferritin